MNYQLDIQFDPGAVQEFAALGQAVTIVKPSGPEDPVIAWLQFQPLMANTVTWTDAYFLYATTTALPPGAVVAPTLLSPPARRGWTYTFSQDQFAGLQGGPQGSFTVLAQEDGGHYSGLAQQAAANGVPATCVVNAIPVPPNFEATFTPEETVAIFIANYVASGVVLSQVAGNALYVSLTAQTPNASIGYNDATGEFYLSR